jgi:hypothetical protein
MAVDTEYITTSSNSIPSGLKPLCAFVAVAAKKKKVIFFTFLEGEEVFTRLQQEQYSKENDRYFAHSAWVLLVCRDVPLNTLTVQALFVHLDPLSSLKIYFIR